MIDAWSSEGVLALFKKYTFFDGHCVATFCLTCWHFIAPGLHHYERDHIIAHNLEEFEEKIPEAVLVRLR